MFLPNQIRNLRKPLPTPLHISLLLTLHQVAALQLVDQGLVSLDSEEDIRKHLPELANLQVLNGYEGDDGSKPIFGKQERGITLRMLMSHTAGEFWT
jgi:hypothetical protein